MDSSSFVSSVPVVLIQGTWDISTPPENATGLRAIFPNNTFILVEGGSHGSIYEAEDADSNMPAALNHWYATGDPSLLPTQVKLSPLTWTEKDRE